MSLFRKALFLGAMAAGASYLTKLEKDRIVNKRELKKGDQVVDRTIDDSFPASDPPAWNSGTAVGAPVNA